MDARPLAIDLFAGGGGLSKGLEQAGFNVRLAVESGVDQASVYMVNHPKTLVLCKRVEEITHFASLVQRVKPPGREIDLVAGGPPCQGFSVANTRTRSASNSHSKMVWEYVRAVKEIKPKAFLMENVLGMKTLNDGALVADLISKFDKMGYYVSEMQLTASEFGVPQNRTRFILLGSRIDEIPAPRPTHGPDTSNPYVTVADAIIGDLPQLNMSAGTAEAKYSSGAKSEYQEWVRDGSEVLYDHITTLCGQDVKRRLGLIKQGENLKSLVEQDRLPPELKVRIDHGGVYRRLCSGQPSVTMVNLRKAMIIHPVENRLLSIREAARLQSFQDSYRFDGKLSFMQQIVGDSVPPLLAEVVARRIRRQVAE
jgi:DNA (cytosine-5)-methyltransferase 1